MGELREHRKTLKAQIASLLPIFIVLLGWFSLELFFSESIIHMESLALQFGPPDKDAIGNLWDEMFPGLALLGMTLLGILGFPIFIIMSVKPVLSKII